jgi:hypothetical protein
MATVPVFECGPSGGTGGDPFHDEIPAAGVTVANIRVFSGRNARVGSGKYLNSIQLFYSDHSQTVRHGHAKGTRRDIALAGLEHIVEVSGFYGLFIDQLSIRTSSGRNLGPFGGNGGTRQFRYHVPDGMAIIGFSGSSGDCVDALGIFYRPI